MLCLAFAKLVMRAAGEQAKKACENLQLCAGLESVIERVIKSVVQRRIEWVRRRRWEEEEAENPEEDEERVGVARLLNNLTIETAGTEE